MNTGKLTEKQRRFVQEYSVDLCATKAARRAGYSQRNADKIGPELLGKTRVARAIQEAQQHQSERLQLTTDRVIQGLLAEAMYDGEDTSHSARIAAWAHLGKHLGMFRDKIEVSGSQDEAYKELLVWAKALNAEQANGNGHYNGHA